MISLRIKQGVFMVCAAIVLSLLWMQVASAAVGIPPEYLPENVPTSGNIGTNEGGSSYGIIAIQGLLGKFISVALLLAAAVAIFELINNSFLMNAAAGNAEMVEKHKKGIFWSVIGLVLIMVSYVTIRFVINLIVLSGEEAPASAPSSSIVRELAKMPEASDYL